jgi:hypothetical protein
MIATDVQSGIFGKGGHGELLILEGLEVCAICPYTVKAARLAQHGPIGA